MKELSDSEFDDIFRKRVNESAPEFEEGAWNMMENKLRRRACIVFFRNASAALAAILVLAVAFYFYDQPTKEQSKISQKKEEFEKVIPDDNPIQSPPPPLVIQQNKKPPTIVPPTYSSKATAAHSEVIIVTNKTIMHPKSLTSADSSDVLQVDVSPQRAEANASIPDPGQPAEQTDKLEVGSAEEPVKIKNRNHVKFGLALSAGPDFNSIKSIVGSKATLGVGILLDASLSNKVSVSTGVRYGGKSYETSASSYGLTNPELLKTITYVDGSCDVLEIPLRASYKILNNNKNSVKLNAGLSSYLMLKEKYVFNYTPESKIEDFVLEKQNANQHYFSVAEISATYRLKTKKSNVEFGIEPYVKIPLGGVGEGNVRLKSSGITLNMFYDLSKKNKQ